MTRKVFLVLSLILVSPVSLMAQGYAPAKVARGLYIFSVEGGCGCHNPEGQPANVGGAKRENPYVLVFAPNITPDPETGIGSWSDKQVIDAFRFGKRPDGQQLSMGHPYYYFSGMADEDAEALVAYLRSLPPVKRSYPPRVVKKSVPVYDLPTPPVKSPSDGTERGRYLAERVGKCNYCHGAPYESPPDMSKYLAGRKDPARLNPNITPDVETGIGKWSVDEIAHFLRTGARPDGSQAGSIMANLIKKGLKDITPEDARAIALYLKSVPPVKNKP
ncbi:MAG: c-type cytochrome [Deltaproteobacteria bacterium]|nr:c-type cytochrome [Deltaproteobacteria bacterium]